MAQVSKASLGGFSPFIFQPYAQDHTLFLLRSTLWKVTTGMAPLGSLADLSCAFIQRWPRREALEFVFLQHPCFLQHQPCSHFYQVHITASDVFWFVPTRPPLLEHEEHAPAFPAPFQCPEQYLVNNKRAVCSKKQK